MDMEVMFLIDKVHQYGHDSEVLWNVVSISYGTVSIANETFHEIFYRSMKGCVSTGIDHHAVCMGNVHRGCS